MRKTSKCIFTDDRLVHKILHTFLSQTAIGKFLSFCSYAWKYYDTHAKEK